MRQTINRAREILAGNGIVISNADIQALLWYAEKDLLEAYGVRKGQGLKNDYVDGAKSSSVFFSLNAFGVLLKMF